MTDVPERYMSIDRKGPVCGVGHLLSTLQGDRLTLLQQLLDTPHVVGTKVQQHSEEDFGVRISAGTFLRHRRGDCNCDR